MVCSFFSGVEDKDQILCDSQMLDELYRYHGVMMSTDKVFAPREEDVDPGFYRPEGLNMTGGS